MSEVVPPGWTGAPGVVDASDFRSEAVGSMRGMDSGESHPRPVVVLQHYLGLMRLGERSLGMSRSPLKKIFQRSRQVFARLCVLAMVTVNASTKRRYASITYTLMRAADVAIGMSATQGRAGGVGKGLTLTETVATPSLFFAFRDSTAKKSD